MASLSRPAVGLQPIASSSLAARRCGLLPLTQQQRLSERQQQEQLARLPRPAGRSSSLQCAASAAAFAAASFDGAGSSGGGADPPSYVHHPGGIAAVFAAIRAVLFYCTTFIFASPLFLCMLAVYPFVLQFDKYRWMGTRVGPHACLVGRNYALQPGAASAASAPGMHCARIRQHVLRRLLGQPCIALP